MSRVTVRKPSQKSVQHQLFRLMGLGPSLAATTLEVTRSFVQEASCLIADAVPGSPVTFALPKLKLGADKCCEIPETECPPRCPCEIVWKAARGEKLVCRLRITNTSDRPRTLTLEATPFEGGTEPPDAGIEVHPGQADLQPGESVTVTGRLTVTDTFEPGGVYVSEVLIRSDHEQCVRVELCVEPDCVVHCEIEHGERPVRIRAHRWTDHFQCVEPCPPEPVP